MTNIEILSFLFLYRFFIDKQTLIALPDILKQKNYTKLLYKSVSAKRIFYV